MGLRKVFYFQCFAVATLYIYGALSVQCPDGWVPNGASCYKFHNEEAITFIEAQESCNRDESYLVHVDDDVENTFLVNTVQTLMPINSWWIGLTDNDTEGVFQWVDDMANITYQHFNAHQPDDHASRHDEDCVIIWHAQHWGWNDANCKLHFHYVCEINADPDIIG
ncbi:perlucin-like protein [Mya arenaria]|uniref:perlucin-like protein n=1 Tax=Mya arenaria TaxID=6604 RepID=UPI0022E65BB7|nr:perlucin-like protein [Mya arenaria]